MDTPNHDLLNPSSAVTNFFNPEPRTPSRSPRRSERGLNAAAENIYRDLSPSKTLRAIVASSGPTADIPHDEETLIKSIENATEDEKAFGVKVAEGSKLVKQWCVELDSWPWQGDFSPPAMAEDKSSTRGESGYFEARTNVGSKAPDEEFWGSLSSRNVMKFEERLEDIKDQLVGLDLEGQKQHVLHSYQLYQTEATDQIEELATEAEYTHLDGLTALITVTVLQALPFYSRLATLISVWAARLAVLRQVPGLFRELSATRKALDKAWYSLKSGPGIAFNANVVSGSDQLMGPDSYHGIQASLKENIAALGKRIDVMLDALEGHEETLPDHWIDMVETLEKDFVGWSGEMEVKLSRDKARAEADVLITQQVAVVEEEHTSANNKLPTHEAPSMDGSVVAQEPFEEKASLLKNNELSVHPASAFVDEVKFETNDSISEKAVVDDREELASNNLSTKLDMDAMEGTASQSALLLPQHLDEVQSLPNGSHRQSVTFALPPEPDVHEPKSMGNLVTFGIAEDEDEDRSTSRNGIADVDEDPLLSQHLQKSDGGSIAHTVTSRVVPSDDSETPTAAVFSWAGVNGFHNHRRTDSDDPEKPMRRHHRPQDSVAFSEISVYHSVGTRDSMDSSGSLFFTPDISKRGSMASSQDVPPFDNGSDALAELTGLPTPINDNRSSVSSNFSEPLDLITETEELDDHAVESSLSGTEEAFTTPSLQKTSAIPRRRKIPILTNSCSTGLEDDSFGDSLSETPPTSTRSNAEMDKLDREIGQILTTLPAPVLFAKDSRNHQHQYGLPSSRFFNSRRSVSPGIKRQATPELTLAPAQQSDSRSIRDGAANDIRLYYLTPAGRDPIKLYVRLVGTNDERVMVRVGGGWADLADYLSEYALHHRRAATFSELPYQSASNSTRIPSTPSALRKKPSFTTGGQSSSNIPIPRIPATPKTGTAPRTISLSGNFSGRRSSTPTLRRPGTAGSDTSSTFRSSTPLSQMITEDGLMDSPGGSSPGSAFIHAGNLDNEADNVGFDEGQSSGGKSGSRIPRFSTGGMFRDLGSVGKTRRVFRVSGIGKGS